MPDEVLWRSQDGASEVRRRDYGGVAAAPDDFFAIARVMRPALIERDGLHFLASHFDEALYTQLTICLDSPLEVQRSMNLIHVATLFGHPGPGDRDALAAARVLAEIWSSVFAHLGLRAESAGEEAGDATVTLYASAAGVAPQTGGRAARGAEVEVGREEIVPAAPG